MTLTQTLSPFPLLNDVALTDLSDPPASVNAWLEQLAAHGVSGGTLDITGTTKPTADSAGLGDLYQLGWTILGFTLPGFTVGAGTIDFTATTTSGNPVRWLFPDGTHQLAASGQFVAHTLAAGGTVQIQCDPLDVIDLELYGDIQDLSGLEDLQNLQQLHADTVLPARTWDNVLAHWDFEFVDGINWDTGNVILDVANGTPLDLTGYVGTGSPNSWECVRSGSGKVGLNAIQIAGYGHGFATNKDAGFLSQACTPPLYGFIWACITWPATANIAGAWGDGSQDSWMVKYQRQGNSAEQHSYSIPNNAQELAFFLVTTDAVIHEIRLPLPTDFINNWHFIEWKIEEGSFSLAFNGGAWQSKSISQPVRVAPVFQLANWMRDSRDGSVWAGTYYNSYTAYAADELHLQKWIPSDEQRAFFYNDGLGRAYGDYS